MSETDLGGSGAGSILGEKRMFDSNVPYDFTEGNARWLRAGFIETDTAKFDGDFWAGSIATYWTDGFSAGAALHDVAINAAGIGLALKGSGTVGEILRTTDFGKTWTTITVSAGFTTGQYMRAVKWVQALGLFVIVGDSGKILTTPDGNTYTARTSNSTNHLMALEYANGIFVAVGTAGEILTSPDAVIWTKRTTGTGSNLLSVCFGNGVWFVGATANGNNSCRSTNNGVSWQGVMVDASTNAGIQGCLYDGTQFVLTASAKGIYKSTDGGVTWVFVTARAGYSSNSLIIYEDGYYMMPGDSSSGTYFRSKDLVNWTTHSVLPNQSSPGTIRRIRKCGAHYFIMGDAGVIYRGNGYKYAGSPWPVMNTLNYTVDIPIQNKQVSFHVRIS